jgi:hypothetical protein
MRRKVIKKTILGIAIILVILLLSADIYVMLYGGEYLAESILPPLPEDRIKVSDGCLIGSSDKCRGIDYMTTKSPESIIADWSDVSKMIITSTSPYIGEIFYTYEACNHSFLGYQYAALHVMPHHRAGFPCAGVSVYYDNSRQATVIRTDLLWTNCLRIIQKYVPYQISWLYRHCNNG